MNTLQTTVFISMLVATLQVDAFLRRTPAPRTPPSPVAPSQPAAPTGLVQVQSITHIGEGCPAGTVSTAITGDVMTFSIIYSGMQTEIVPNSPILHVLKKCWSKISLTLPPGTQLLIEGAEYRGFYSLQDDAIWARFNTKYFFNNGAAYVHRNYHRSWMFMGGFSMAQQGPSTENFLWQTDAGGIKQFTQCGGPTELNIINTVGLTSSRSSSGAAVFDTMDAQFVHTYRAKLTNCNYRFRPFPDDAYRFTNPQLEQVGGTEWRER